MMMFRILIDHGADVNVQDEEELTPLHCAARGGFLDVVSFLVSSGSSTKHTTCEEKIPVWYACIEGNTNVVEFLLRHPHETTVLLEDKKFVYSLMKIAKIQQFKLIENFLFVSPAPADSGAKLSATYR